MGQMTVGYGEVARVVELLSTPCDCSQVAIADAIQQMWPRQQTEPVTLLPLVFTVHCSVHNFQYLRPFVKELNGPLPPQMNLVIDYELAREAWYVSDGLGQLVGSTGAF